MFRSVAAIKTVLLACFLGSAPPVSAQNPEAFNPPKSSYEMLGKQAVGQSKPSEYLAHQRTTGDKQALTKKQVMDAIWSAAQHTGVDYNYLLAQAQLESGLDPMAKARTSSAAGLFQFIEGTWLRSLDRYGSQVQAFRASELVGTYKFGQNGRSADTDLATRSERLEWRHDPRLASLVAAVYAQENGRHLKKVLGRRALSTELYVAHFLGTGGAVRFVSAWKRNPRLSAASLFPRAARANRAIFYTRSGRPRSLQNLLQHFEIKMNRALARLDLASAETGTPSQVTDFPPSCDTQKVRAANVLSLIGDSAGRHHDRQTRETSLRASINFSYGMSTWVKNLVFERFRSDSAKDISSLSWRHDPTLQGIRLSDHLASTTNLRRTYAKHSETPSSHRETCSHTEMCYQSNMDTSTITLVRDLIESGAYTKAGIARAAGLHANTLRDASEHDWNPTAETLAKLQRFLDANDDTPVLVGAEEIIDEARNGRMYILVDDEDRENEGDLIIPAQMATPAAVNFMATHGRGLICLALDKARVDQLGLDPMSRNNKESMQTAFTVSIEAKEGVTTGISAADRARTISVAIDASKDADDIVTPGHVFPLMARDGGTLVRAGHTEAAVDISRLAGLNPSGVICEIMNEDGSMARLDDLIEFARKHELKIGTIRDLIAYRMRNDHLVERIEERSFESDYGGQWRMITYRNTVSDNQAYVLQKGHITPDEPTLARVHPISVFDDVLGAPGPRKRTLQRAMGAIGEKGSGVIVILTQRVGRGTKWTPDEEHRNIGIGSQILADLGVHEMILLSNSRPDLVALEGFGITLAGHQSIPD